MTTSKKYIIDNKEFQVSIDEKDYIIIKHLEPKTLKKHIFQMADKTSNMIMIENNNKMVYKYLIDCFEEKKLILVEIFENIITLRTIFNNPYKKMEYDFNFKLEPFDKYDTLEIEYEKLQKENDIQKEENNKLKKEHNKITEEHNKLKEEHNKIKEEHNKLTENHIQLSNSYNQLEENYYILEENRNNLKEEHNKLTENYNQLGENYYILEEKRNNLKEERNNLKEEHNKLKEVNDTDIKIYSIKYNGIIYNKVFIGRDTKNCDAYAVCQHLNTTKCGFIKTHDASNKLQYDIIMNKPIDF